MSHQRRIQRPTRRANVRCPAVIFAGWVTGFGRTEPFAVGAVRHRRVSTRCSQWRTSAFLEVSDDGQALIRVDSQHLCSQIADLVC
jgi:hypothetical protein